MTIPAADRVTNDTFTMTRQTYDVFKRVPAEWRVEADVVEGISLSLARTMPSVASAIGWLIRAALVERRGSPQIHGRTEIRKRAGRS